MNYLIFSLGIVIRIKALDRTPRLILMIKGKLNQAANFRAPECLKESFSIVSINALPNSVNFTLHSLTSESLFLNFTHPSNAEGPALPAIRFVVGWS